MIEIIILLGQKNAPSSRLCDFWANVFVFVVRKRLGLEQPLVPSVTAARHLHIYID